MPPTFHPSGQSPLARLFAGFRVQRRVIGALILRELHSRYGRDNIGYLWLIGEPMILASIITLIHANTPSSHYGNDIGAVPFTIIGYTIFIIFRGIFNRSEGAVHANQPLLHHRMVSIFDILVARALIEVAGCFVVLCILLFAANAFGYADWPERPLHLLAGVAFMAWWSFALGTLAACATYGSESLARLMHPFSYFMIPASGAFYQMEWLPESWRDILAWFPMPLIFEEARYGQFRSAPDTYVTPGYVAAVCAALTAWALLSLRRLRRRVHVG